jgi:hypothetical protein
MKTNNFEQALALAGALIVMIGVSTAANLAFADEANTADKVAAATESSQAISDSANRATTQAIDEAILTVRLDNELDLDIRLLDRNSQLAWKL